MKPENWLTIDLSVDGCLCVALHASTFYDLRPGNGAGPILTTPRAHTGQQQSEVFCASLHIYICVTQSRHPKHARMSVDVPEVRLLVHSIQQGQN